MSHDVQLREGHYGLPLRILQLYVCIGRGVRLLMIAIG